MKILYLSTSILISDTANSVHVTKMCQAFAKLGHDVTLHGLRGEGSEDEIFSYYGVESNFRVVRHDESDDPVAGSLWMLRKRVPGLRVGGVPSILYARRVLDRHLREATPDLVFARNTYWLAGLRAAVPCIVDSHGLPSSILKHQVEARIFRRPNFKGLVVTSKNMRRFYLKRYPKLESRIILARNGAEDPHPERYIRKAVGGFHVGYVGHLYEGRGVELILSIAREISEATFHIVGGTKEDRRRVCKLPRSDNVIFHGHQPHPKLANYYPRFDLVLAPYQSRISVSGSGGNTAADMSPLKLFEYMSWGKAILCSDMPLLQEILTNGNNAVLLPPSNVDAWINAIRRMLYDEGERNRLGAKARQDFPE